MVCKPRNKYDPTKPTPTSYDNINSYFNSYASKPVIKLIYYCDNKRHLVCKPYSKENLHLMAKKLGLKKCWFHKNHYDIPQRRRKIIESQCIKVSSKEIVRIIKS